MMQHIMYQHAHGESVKLRILSAHSIRQETFATKMRRKIAHMLRIVGSFSKLFQTPAQVYVIRVSRALCLSAN